MSTDQRVVMLCDWE